MKVNSTGLGKTTLTSHISELSAGETGGLTMKIESTQPVHWYITCQMTPGDVRTAMKMVLRPKVVFRVLSMALGFGAAPEAEEPATAAEAKTTGRTPVKAAKAVTAAAGTSAGAAGKAS